MTMSKENAAEVLINISKFQEQRSAKMNKFSATGTSPTSDNEEQEENPVIETFSESGRAGGIMKFTSFFPYEFMHIYLKI